MFTIFDFHSTIVHMPHFQSFLVVAPNKQSARERTQKLAKELKIDLGKISPDIFIISAQKREISIDQIRELKNHIFQKPLVHPLKIVIIENAHHATIPAQNSLLKILEEPPKHAIIILEAKSKTSLLPTIVSRTTVISQAVADENHKIILGENLENALAAISSIEDPEDFLDEQIAAASKMLESKAHGQNITYSFAQLSRAIEAMAQAKQMITSNVNPTFVLANLIFSLHL